MDSSNKVIFENFSVKVNEDDFYEIEVFNDKEFSFLQLEELIKVQIAWGSNKKPVLILCEEFASTDTSFAKHLSKNKNNPFSAADAFVITSMAQKLIANFYLKISTPERPTRFFKDKGEATEWLKQFA
ncbi:MAG: hypothetical protein HY062_05420 [Bacteroidetes bacterium]|nr:hypothetical protein [Bacteroidota bacterium]